MLITRGRIKKIRNVLFAAIGVYVMLGAALYVFQERMLFLPTVLEDDYSYTFEAPFEELMLVPEADVKINALHFKVKDPKGIILYSHGNAGDLSRWGEIASYFTRYGYDVLVWDYRTYGKSKGKLSEEAIYRDAQYLFDLILKEFNPQNIILYGRSLGTGVASYLACQNELQQLILETPYYSITDVAKHRFPFFPVERLMSYEFPNFKYLQKVDVPITIIHGTDDSVVPITSANKLEDIRKENLTFITVEGGAHNNLVDFEAFHSTIANCLK